jgi:putative alpha-1,2-mannosidase
LPVWELVSNENRLHDRPPSGLQLPMRQKEIEGFDYEKCFEAAKHSAMLDHLGLEAYKKNGFINDDESTKACKTVEYAYDDWCIAPMAKDFK